VSNSEEDLNKIQRSPLKNEKKKRIRDKEEKSKQKRIRFGQLESKWLENEGALLIENQRGLLARELLHKEFCEVFPSLACIEVDGLYNRFCRLKKAKLHQLQDQPENEPVENVGPVDEIMFDAEIEKKQQEVPKLEPASKESEGIKPSEHKTLPEPLCNYTTSDLCEALRSRLTNEVVELDFNQKLKTLLSSVNSREQMSYGKQGNEKQDLVKTLLTVNSLLLLLLTLE
jgi:hypothetical protein